MKKTDFPDISFSGVVHVGACRGEELPDHVEMGAKKIVWVEANPDVYGEMQVALAGSSIENHTFCVACTDSDDEKIEFNLIYGPDADFMVGNKGCSSIFEPTEKLESWFKEKIVVDTITLDTLIRRNNFNFSDFQLLEMDVQGGELKVLQGADELLNHVKYIYSEVTFYDPEYKGSPLFEEIKTFLEKYDFEYVDTILHAPNWGDALFIKRNKNETE
jgi:FkbM family methyltransferase